MADPDRLPTRPRSVLEDPSAVAVSRVYAEAFLRAAASSGVEGALEEFRSFLDDVLNRNPEFRSILLSNVVSRDDKMGIIERAIAPHGSPLFVNFLRVLARHDRLDLLPAILDESQRQWELQAGRRRVYVTTARPLSDSSRERIIQQLRESMHFEPIIEARVEPALVGGMVVQIGDTIYDTSLRTRLRQLAKRLQQRSRHEIQSGRDRFSSPEGD